MFTKVLFYATLGVSFVLAFPTPDHNELQHKFHDLDLDPLIFDYPTVKPDKECPVVPKKIETSTSTALPTKHSRWQRAKEKFLSLKRHCHNLYEKVKHELQSIKGSAHKIKENLSKAKEQTMKLVSDAEAVYKRIIVDGEHAFHEFGKVYDDLKVTIEHLKTEGGEFYHEVKNLLEELKQEVIDAKNAIANGELDRLKENWHNVQKKWSLAVTKFDNLFKKVVKHYEKTKKDAHVLINGVQKNIEEVKKEANELLIEAKKKYKEIIVDGKGSYAEFEKSYESLMKILDTVKPGVDDIHNELESLLSEFNLHVKEHEKFVKLKATPITYENKVSELDIDLILLSEEKNDNTLYSVDS